MLTTRLQIHCSAAGSIVLIFPDGIVLGRVFENLPASGKTLGDDETVPSFEGAAFARVADQPKVAVHDIAELVFASERAPLAWSAFPDPGYKAAVGAFEIRVRDVLRLAFQKTCGVGAAVQLLSGTVGKTDDG